MPRGARQPGLGDDLSRGPLAVHGTGTALRKHDWHFGRSTAVVRVLEPIETSGLTPADVPALKERVRTLIAGARDELAASLQRGDPT